MAIDLRLRRLAASLVLAFVAVPAGAANLVVNGSFETNGGVGYLDYNTTATGWTNAGATDGRPNAFNFIIDANADKDPGGGFNSELGTIWVWGPQYTPAPSNNGFQGSGVGTYFLGGDGAYASGWVSQQISGLTVGSQYELSFLWAAAQFTDVTDKAFDAGWKIQFGSDIVHRHGACGESGIRPLAVLQPGVHRLEHRPDAVVPRHRRSGGRPPFLPVGRRQPPAHRRPSVGRAGDRSCGRGVGPGPGGRMPGLDRSPAATDDRRLTDQGTTGPAAGAGRGLARSGRGPVRATGGTGRGGDRWKRFSSTRCGSWSGS